LFCNAEEGLLQYLLKAGLLFQHLYDRW
jgi:hypothetical protein